MTASWQPTDRLDLGLSYTWLDAEDPNGEIEVRRPEHEYGLTASYLLPNDATRISGTLRGVSGLYDLDFTTPNDSTDRVKLDDYALVDLNLRQDFDNGAYLAGSISNLFNTDYEELDGYGTEGRVAYLGVGMRF